MNYLMGVAVDPASLLLGFGLGLLALALLGAVLRPLRAWACEWRLRRQQRRWRSRMRETMRGEVTGLRRNQAVRVCGSQEMPYVPSWKLRDAGLERKGESEL